MRKVYLILLVVLLAGYSFAQQGASKRYLIPDLTTPPSDSLNAEMTRIWVPVDKYRAKVKVEIQDRRRRPVRTLVEKYVGKGYYNFYWDKKDDNGHFVSPGKYIYYTTVDNVFDKDSLMITYRDGEKEFSYNILADNSGFDYNISKDSTLVSLILKYRFGDTSRVVFTDSLFAKGDYQFVFDESDRSSQYIIIAKVNSFVHEFDITYRKNRK